MVNQITMGAFRMFMDVEVNIGEPTKTGPGMILTCPDVCVIKRCIWAAVNWKSTGWTTFELYLEKCDDVMYITQEVTVLSLERYLKLAICYILVCCLHTIHTIPCRLVKYHEICFFCYVCFLQWRMLGETVPTVDETWIQRIRSSRTAATSMDGQLARHHISFQKL